MKAVHFGAGNIGRGFIGQLLSESGYEVCFVTRNPEKVRLLQQRGRYDVLLANETCDVVSVENVTALSVDDVDAVTEAITSADLVTTAVGSSALKNIAPVIAQAIATRVLRNSYPLHMIACENAIRASSMLKQHVYNRLDSEVRELAEHSVAFLDAVVDRIVPVQRNDNPLTVKVEPFFEWIVDRSNMLSDLKEIGGAEFVSSLDPYLERKLFTVNTGHCSAAYFGYLEGYRTIQDAMQDSRLKAKVKMVLRETGRLLEKKHKLDPNEHEQYIRRILERFSNPHIVDHVVRVARCPIRKLSANERLVLPIIQAHEHGLSTPHLSSVISAALLFNYEKDKQARKLQTMIMNNGIYSTITKLMGIAQHHAAHRQVASTYKQLKRRYRNVRFPSLAVASAKAT